MNSNPRNPLAPESVPAAVSGSVASSAEETLRLIASLPAPTGLEDRVHAALRSARHSGRLLAWPRPLKPQSAWMIRDWMRTAAAAAIVFVVAGGGWGVYTHVQIVQQGQPAKIIAIPRVIQPGGFSGAGAMRTPQTLPGPSVILPVKQPPAPTKVMKKPARHAPAKAATAQATPVATTAPQPAASR